MSIFGAAVGPLTVAFALYAFASWCGLKTWRTGAEMYAAGIAGMVAIGLGTIDVAATIAWRVYG